MSRQNKVNPGQYTSAGRLSPDDLGREKRRQDGKAAAARTPKTERPAWETTPASNASSARPIGAPGRLKVAAARTTIGVTRATVRAVKTVTRAAKAVVGARAGRSSAKAAKTAKAPARARKAPARAARAVKRTKS